MTPSHRLILMTGTPHQGHRDRFDNLLTLLQSEGETAESIAGRVIYRTKDDVCDWDGRPLFPKRQVNMPRVVDLGPNHRGWLEHIHDLFEPSEEIATSGQARRRAVGWRCGQALQWATSSIEAGLGYLVRQAIRAGWPTTQVELADAIVALRPYRRGRVDEPVADLYSRIAKEVGRQDNDGDIDDLEEDDEATETARWKPDRLKLTSLLAEGVRLLRAAPDAKWQYLYDEILVSAGSEKVVLFAQPIETVTALARFLEAKTGKPPARIVGMQSEEERTAEIEAFWSPSGPQFLVSSRAGGEGLNLQVARRLVHVDVPWNPMELEQRVGRVHRFMSKKKIIVDTVVVRDSREVHTYRIAREKLEQISKAVVPADRFDATFSRVMSLVPPDELQDILGERALGPLNDEETGRIAQLVSQGFERWKGFHDRYSAQLGQIRALDAGQARWSDLARFARDHLGARPAEGFSALRFRWDEGDVVEASETATVLEIEGAPFACGDYGGMPVTRDDGRRAESLGLNVPLISHELRRIAFPEAAVGAAHIRWPDGHPPPVEGIRQPFALLMIARVTLRSEQGTFVETNAGLHAAVVTVDAPPIMLSPEIRGNAIRAMLDAVARREPEDAPLLVEAVRREGEGIIQSLRRPTEDEHSGRISHAVIPLVAAIVS
jgi:hypothetical protein